MISLPFEQYASINFFDDIRKNEEIRIIFKNQIPKMTPKRAKNIFCLQKTPTNNQSVNLIIPIIQCGFTGS